MNAIRASMVLPSRLHSINASIATCRGPGRIALSAAF
jgi:hypothetical protein